MIKPRKQHVCPICSVVFIKYKSTQKVCGDADCALKYARRNTEEKKLKEERKRLKIRKIELKPRNKLMAEAQSAFNKYVRLKDYFKPCISCGRHVENKPGGSYDCGHYRTRKSAHHLRFNLHNTAKQCVWCNRYRSGAQLDFRAGLVERIGEEKVIAIDNNNEIRRFDNDYLKRIKAIFTRKAKMKERRINCFSN